MDREARLLELERRLQRAEDQLEIQNLLMSYGPLVDSATAGPAGELWVPGGGYNFTLPDGGAKRLEAPDEIAGMYAWPGHLDLVNTGCAHLTATPKITVEGDDAQAVGYSVVILKEGERWFLWRAAVNHWTLKRTADGWRIVERFNRALDGSPESHATMKKVLDI
ncbi:nuclear transport factor 2 family protein [Novosphingobium sp. TH158]|uniref:nuclear transport factor 2 family protein n=1 Tax=Novosphingobium sp. TH158 TaxID=2067455 RepID=UPI000C79E9F5|nr:nuclear transport factor 2 family protein [Novosphingobium sp. TH158]PLK26518.1 nuclear transport factor 2 family protein [Novosphingobium sp. TH158]